ncbi:MAG: hypothetical protein HRU25_08045 [Psychrobium sp.]|nr:hypothetical protein [Psychrobium sp.]
MDSSARELQEPFDEDDIEWRVQQAGITNGRAWVMAIPYVTARAVESRLDNLFTPFGWQLTQQATPDGKGYLCGLSILHNDKWITKWDGAEYTNIEPLKGALSGALKRAAVVWGIGRYLYRLNVAFADCRIIDNRHDCIGNFHTVKERNSKKLLGYIDWVSPMLPNWALPGIEGDKYIEKINSSNDISELKGNFSAAYTFAKTFNRSDLAKQFTKAKEATKARLNQEAADNVTPLYELTSTWLNQQLKSLSLIPNASAVETVCERTKEQLTAKCTGQYFDTASLFERLNDAKQSRIKEFKNKVADHG